VTARGAKPLPTKIKALRGTLRKHRANANEPKAQPGMPACPAELGIIAKREWRRISRHLSAMGLLTTADRAALALYCDAYGRWLEAIKALQQYGVVIKSPNGYPVQSPYVAIANKAGEQVRLLLGEFGMSPASRTRVTAAPLSPELDELDLWRAGRRQSDGERRYLGGKS